MKAKAESQRYDSLSPVPYAHKTGYTHKNLSPSPSVLWVLLDFCIAYPMTELVGCLAASFARQPSGDGAGAGRPSQDQVGVIGGSCSRVQGLG